MKILRSLCMMILFSAVIAASALSDDPEPNIVPVPESIRERVSTSSAGLVEEFAISGRMVFLNGRFQSLSTAKKDETGRLKVEGRQPKSDLKHHPINRD